MSLRRLRHAIRRLRHRAVLVVVILGLLAAAWVIARWLAASAGGFPVDPP
jgi:hypothetical protein